MPAALKHGEDRGTEARSFIKATRMHGVVWGQTLFLVQLF